MEDYVSKMITNEQTRKAFDILQAKVDSAQARVKELEEALGNVLPDVDCKMSARFSPWPDFFCEEHACELAAIAFRDLIQESLKAVLDKKHCQN